MRRSASIVVAVLMVVCSFAWMGGSRSQEIISPKGNNNANNSKDASPDKEKSPANEHAKDESGKKKRPRPSPSPN
jgi:hypothetical protein